MANWFNKSATTIHTIDCTAYGSLRAQGRRWSVTRAGSRMFTVAFKSTILLPQRRQLLGLDQFDLLGKAVAVERHQGVVAGIERAAQRVLHDHDTKAEIDGIQHRRQHADVGSEPVTTTVPMPLSDSSEASADPVNAE